MTPHWPARNVVAIAALLALAIAPSGGCGLGEAPRAGDLTGTDNSAAAGPVLITLEAVPPEDGAPPGKKREKARVVCKFRMDDENATPKTVVLALVDVTNPSRPAQMDTFGGKAAMNDDGDYVIEGELRQLDVKPGRKYKLRATYRGETVAEVDFRPE